MICRTKPPGTPVPGGAREKVWVGTVLAHTTADLVPVLQTVLGALTAAGFGRQELFGARLALEEAVVNGLRHGHRGDPGKDVRVTYLITAAEMRLDVEDEGPGFRPGDVPDPLAPENRDRPGGRGLLLMRHYMTEVRFNETGNCVTLILQRGGR
jgi:serine/threonine-protein kinase RsbW